MGPRKAASHHDLLDLALQAGTQAAAFIRESARPETSAWDRKARNDFATEVDRTAERIIADILLDGAPDSTVLGEESVSSGPPVPPRPPGLTWVVDPLDGTTNFLHNYPAYAVSIAAVVDGAPVVGVVVDLVRDVVYRAAADAGAWRGDVRLAVSTIAEPALALIGTGFPFKAPANARTDEYVAQFRRVLHATSGIRRAGSAALDLAYVAEGRLEGFWEIGLAAWDVAAGVLLVREAGGVVTNFAGEPAPIAPGDFVAASATMHAWLLEQVSEKRRAGEQSEGRT
jgi:myo-inositol-1(or 4)-monophosphatase